MSTKWLERTYLNRTPASAASGQPASLAAARCRCPGRARHKSKSETFVIEMNNRRVKLTVPLDIVENITGLARARGAKRPTQPLAGAGLHNVASSAAAVTTAQIRRHRLPDAGRGHAHQRVRRASKRGQGRPSGGARIHEDGELRVRRAAGEVKKIFVGPADGVEAGDTLVTLDVNAGKAILLWLRRDLSLRRLRRQLPRQKGSR